MPCYQDKVPMQDKLDQILAWIDLPLEKRPQLITGLHMNGSFACLSDRSI